MLKALTQQHYLILFISHQFAWNISRLRATFRKCDFMLDNIKSNVLCMGCSWRFAQHKYWKQCESHSSSLNSRVQIIFCYMSTFQQYIKKGRAFTEMLPWNIITVTWVQNLLIKSASTVYSRRACCVDLGASLTDPGYRAHTHVWSLWWREKKKQKYYPLQKCVWYHFKNQIRQIVSASLANVNPH